MGQTKRPWPTEEVSPWANDPNPPTVFEATRMYPGRAVRNAIISLIAGLFLGTFIGAGIGWLVNSIAGVDIARLLKIIVFLVVTPASWWLTTSAEVRGHIILTGGDGD